VPAYTAKTTERLLAEHLISADWPDFNLLDFSIPRVLHAKVQATTHSNLAALCPSSTVEWDWLAVVYVYLQNMLLIPLLLLSYSITKKN
jgi:hypothetical protein